MKTNDTILSFPRIGRDRRLAIVSRHRGIALVLVILVMALAAILGYALLSASAVQATAGSNSIAAAQARGQAESGIHMAMYYLLNTANAPALVNSKWANVTFAGIPGSVTVTVTPLGNNEYTVVSAGTSGASEGGGAITRTITANIQVVTTFQIPQAAGFNTAVSIGSLGSYTGSPAIASTGTVTIPTGAQVNGSASAASFAGPGVGAITGQELPAPTIAPAPNQPTDAMFLSSATQPPSYMYNGTQYYAGTINSPWTGGTPPGPTIGNPLGVYYCSGALTVSSALNVNGTLVVNGQLTDKSSITITPVTPIPSTNMPALVVSTYINMNGTGKTLTATGVVYAGDGITGTSTNSTTSISVTGALLITGLSAGTPISNYSGHLTVTYNNSYTNIPNFSSSNQTPTGVKIVSWSE